MIDCANSKWNKKISKFTGDIYLSSCCVDCTIDSVVFWCVSILNKWLNGASELFCVSAFVYLVISSQTSFVKWLQQHVRKPIFDIYTQKNPSQHNNTHTSAFRAVCVICLHAAHGTKSTKFQSTTTASSFYSFFLFFGSTSPQFGRSTHSLRQWHLTDIQVSSCIHKSWFLVFLLYDDDRNWTEKKKKLLTEHILYGQMVLHMLEVQRK